MNEQVESINATTKSATTKPVQLSCRRCGGSLTALPPRPPAALGLIYDRLGMSVHIGGMGGPSIWFTKTETHILAILLRYPGRVVPYETILRRVFDIDQIDVDKFEYIQGIHLLNVHVTRIRITLAPWLAAGQYGRDMAKRIVMSRPCVGYVIPAANDYWANIDLSMSLSWPMRYLLATQLIAGGAPS